VLGISATSPTGIVLGIFDHAIMAADDSEAIVITYDVGKL
jgi:hypothetical protein